MLLWCRGFFILKYMEVFFDKYFVLLRKIAIFATEKGVNLL